MSQEELSGDPVDRAEFPVPPLAGLGQVWPPRTQDGLKMPFRFNWLTFVRAVPGIFSESGLLETRVPEEFVTLDADDQGDPFAVIACPCGETPAVRLAGSKACNCNRVFVNIGRGEVRVSRPPKGIVD